MHFARAQLVFGCLLGGALLGSAGPARAWLLHEHSLTAYEGVASLDAPHRELLGKAWAAAARVSPRLCATPADSGERLYSILDGGETCLSLPVLTGLGGDHSCTPGDLASSLTKPFVLDVLREAEQVHTQLRDVAQDTQAHLDAWHRHHLELQVVDPEYLRRAETNGAHFQLPRQAGADLPSHLARITKKGAASNAIALYFVYHAAALEQASQASYGCAALPMGFSCPPDPQRDERFARAIMSEAFALHFLQDAFSAGHLMTPNGSRAARMGTHDHYCQHGAAARTWAGSEYWALGDSFLSRADAAKVGAAVRSSLEDLTQAMLAPTQPSDLGPPTGLLAFNACTEPLAPAALAPLLAREGVLRTLALTPQPVVWPPGMPQFKQELGVFFGPLLGVAGRVDLAGFEDADRLPFLAFGGFGIGGTFEGVTESTTDGLVALGLNFLLDARPPGSETGIRLGGGLHFHLPYWLVPGDLMLAAPLWFADRNAYIRMARRAAAGGVLDLQRKYSVFGNMKFQFMLGREALAAWMPLPDQSDDPRTAANERQAGLFSFISRPSHFHLAVPVFSLIGFHASADNIGLDAVWQLGYDFTYFYRSEEWVGGASRGDVHHGLFLAFGYRTRRYFYTP